MEDLNNPASRFYSLLKAGQSEGMDEPSSKIWAKLLHVPEHDTPLLLRRIGYVISLPSQIKLEVESIPNVNHDIYLRWLPRVNASIGMLNFQAAWKNFITRFDSEILYGIEICSEMLSRSRPEKVISKSTMESLVDKLAQLQEEFQEENLPPDIAEFIFERLQEVRSAIEEYPLRGSEPLETVIHQCIGKIVIVPTIYQESKNTSFGKKFWEFMGYLAMAVTITAGSIQIGKEVFSLIPSDIDNSESVSDIDKPIEKKNVPSKNDIHVIKT